MWGVSLARHRLNTAAATLEEFCRLILLRFVVGPVSQFGPKAVAIKIIELFSMLIVLFDMVFYGRRQINGFMTTFGITSYEALLLTWKYHALPFTDFAINRRISTDKENVNEWPVKEVNSGGIERLRQERKSYIVATGHFTRQAYMAIGRKDITPGRIVQITLPTNPGTGKIMYDKRIELQFGMSFRAALKIRPDLSLATVGTGRGMVRDVCRSLREPGTAVLINIDAPWDDHHPNYYERAFAGFDKKTFALGVVGLAKMSGCPILPLISRVDGCGGVIMEWGEPVYVDRNLSEEQQIKVLDGLLDQLEQAIGLRPFQYLMPIGNSRKWDKEKKEWIDAT